MSNKNIETIAPLSSVQEGLLYETICAPESGIHIEQSMYTLTGPLEVAALRQAWQWAMQRHAILRTGFVWKQQNNPLQITLHHAPLSFEVQDWRKLSSEQQRAQAEDYLRQERTRGFDLVHPPL
ncbi:MAG TPA: condensation domain-containing protein, partial [Ktedonobacteraceae bacterium]|nr:condensation domain-containing protein [Ktedonobacteraceae bacterium]